MLDPNLEWGWLSLESQTWDGRYYQHDRKVLSRPVSCLPFLFLLVLVLKLSQSTKKQGAEAGRAAGAAGGHVANASCFVTVKLVRQLRAKHKQVPSNPPAPRQHPGILPPGATSGPGQTGPAGHPLGSAPASR